MNLERTFATAIGVLFVACIPSNAAIVEDGRDELHAAGERAQRNLERIRVAWRRESAQVHSEFVAGFVFPVCGKPDIPPEMRCGMLQAEYERPDFRRDFAREHCGRGITIDSAAGCFDLFMKQFIEDVNKRYEVDALGLCAQGCVSLLDIELRALRAHNQVVSIRNTQRTEEIDAKHMRMSEEVLATLDAELNMIRQNVEGRIEEAESLRRALRGAAAGMKAFGDGMARSSTATVSEASPNGCGSDYECGSGQTCVKSPGAMRGFCATAVNEYGTPTHNLPRTDSYRPGVRYCAALGDCPVGFICKAGNCVR